MTLFDTTLNVFEAAYIQINYRVSDLDGDGNVWPGDINETTLCLYWYDTQDSEWVKVTSDQDWVIACGVNTTNFELYGESYAGYVWAQVTHLSLFGIAGKLLAVETALPDATLLLILIGCVGMITLVIVFKRKRRPSMDDQWSLIDKLSSENSRAS